MGLGGRQIVMNVVEDSGTAYTNGPPTQHQGRRKILERVITDIDITSIASAATADDFEVPARVRLEDLLPVVDYDLIELFDQAKRLTLAHLLIERAISHNSQSRSAAEIVQAHGSIVSN